MGWGGEGGGLENHTNREIVGIYQILYPPAFRICGSVNLSEPKV